MAFQVSLEDADFVRSRVDVAPYEQAINTAKETEKAVAIVLETEAVKATKGMFARTASRMGVGLRWDVDRDQGNGTTKIKFYTAKKREHSPEAAAKRKATMEKNGTKAGRPAKTGTTASGKKAS